MKKFAVMILSAAVLVLSLGACLPVDGEPERGGAGMAPESEVSRTAPEESYEEPGELEDWGDELCSFAAYSWNGAFLEDIQSSQDFGDIWWINDEPVSALYGEEVFADGLCSDGVFCFSFNSRRDISELAAASGFTEQELTDCWAREWPWPTWRNAVERWELAVTYKPLPEGKWVTPSWWLPPGDLTFEDWLVRIGDDHFGGNPMLDKYEAGELQIDDPQPTSEYQKPRFTPVEGHDGYEMAIVHAAPDGRPLQVRLRWKDEEGFGFWAQLPWHELDSFWEHEDEWFIEVNVSGSGVESSGDGEDAVASDPGMYASLAGDFPIWEDAEEPVEVDGITMELAFMEDEHLDEMPEHEPYLDWKVFKVKVDLEEELWNPDPYYWRVDYCYYDGWHTVYRPWDPKMRPAAAVHVGPGEWDKDFGVPAPAIWRSGQYRICHDDIGTFEFTIE